MKRSYSLFASGSLFHCLEFIAVSAKPRITIARLLYISYSLCAHYSSVNINVFVINILGEIFIYNISLFNFLSSELLTTREGVVHQYIHF